MTARNYKPRRAAGFLRPVDKFEMRQFREAGMAIRQLMSYFDVSEATVHRALAEMREKFGPEKLPENRRHFARKRNASSQLTTNTDSET